MLDIYGEELINRYEHPHEKGCIISMGSADLLLESIKGKSLKEIEKIGKKELFEIIGIEPGPARLHCATLSLRALKKAVFEFENLPEDKETKEL